MAQTRYLRHVIDLTWRERVVLAFRGRIAVSATVYPDRVGDVKAAPFDGDVHEAHAWIQTGSRDGLPHPDRWNETAPGVARQGRSSIKRVS